MQGEGNLEGEAHPLHTIGEASPEPTAKKTHENWGSQELASAGFLTPT